MRRALVSTVQSVMDTDERLVTLLGDIGVFGFRDAFAAHPTRIYNIGILEQSTVGLAAGLAMVGLLPVVHTIAPFLVERCYEQLKTDFCYQQLGGTFISVGASYDYAALGCTHHCPGDIALMRALPGMEIVVPGTPAEFDALFRATYADGQPTYIRLSERSNPESVAVRFGEAVVIQRGARATVIAVGPTLAATHEAVRDLDVSLLYYTTLAPFDGETLRANLQRNRVALVEPYYVGTSTAEVCAALMGTPIIVDALGVPRQFLTAYGQAAQHDDAVGLTAPAIRARVERLIDA